MGNRFKSKENYGAVAITPSDATDLSSYELRGFYVGGAGNVAIEQPGNDTPVVFVGVPAGSIIPVAVTKVNATSTTATSIVGLL
jgi:hypothetical protein